MVGKQVPDEETTLAQKEVCARYGSAWHEAPLEGKVGISRNVRSGLLPINGLRHPPVGDTTGWYIWAGETLSTDPSFFEPLHVAHLAAWCPDVLPFLGLQPGFRFLIAPGIEDVWEDQTLLTFDQD